jgi:hypothetical protein
MDINKNIEEMVEYIKGLDSLDEVDYTIYPKFIKFRFLTYEYDVDMIVRKSHPLFKTLLHEMKTKI